MIRKAILPALAGLAVGTAATLGAIQYGKPDHTLKTEQIDSATAITADLKSGALTLDLPAMLDGAGTTADRTLLHLLAAQTDADGLSKLIREAAATPHSPARHQALLVFVSRLAEYDPFYALQEIEQLDLDQRLLSRVFGIWAQQDLDSALAALSAESNRARARMLARSILDTLGPNSDTLSRLAAALPDQLRFEDVRLEAILSQASSEPNAAVLTAMQIPEAAERYRALARIASSVARQNPATAMLIGEQLPGGSRRFALEREVLREWANVDPQGLIDRLIESPDSFSTNTLFRSGAIPLLAELDHETLFDAADGFNAEMRAHAKFMALRVWGRGDPDAALASAQSLPAGTSRDQAMQAVALGFSRENPDAALAWAESIQPRPRGMREAVLTGMARKDPERAIRLAVQDIYTPEQQAALTSIIQEAANQGRMRSIAGEVLRTDAGTTRNRALTILANRWAQQDPDAVFAWLGTHPDVASSENYQAVAMRLAQRDPGAAAALTNQVPAQTRAAWVHQVAAIYARSDPNAALDWVSQHTGDENFAAALPAVASVLAQQNPQAAIPVMNRLTDPTVATELARQIARNWATTDPVSAAQWVNSLDDPARLSGASADIARSWAARDFQSAKRWVLKQESGRDRDRALQSLLSGNTAEIDVDTEVLNAFSSDDARQNGAASLAMRYATSDPGRARKIVEQYVTDPALQQRVESAITRPRLVRSNGSYYPW